MNSRLSVIRSDAILLVTAVVWGFAFVAQRVGMEHVGPYTFNGIRFALGSISLVPLLWYRSKTGSRVPDVRKKGISVRNAFSYGAITGGLIFIGASLQQIGLVYTTAGKAGFITGLYVVIVPVIGIFLKQKTGTGTWIGGILAAVGLYFLSVTEEFTISYGDFLELIGAFFWAVHVIVIGRFSRRIDPILLAFMQFAACSMLSLGAAVLFEEITYEGIYSAAIPIFYGGACSVGIGYTLQVVGQKNAPEAHAAIILSSESLFAALGGWLLISEALSGRSILGCALMLSGMIFSRIQSFFAEKNGGNRHLETANDRCAV